MPFHNDVIHLDWKDKAVRRHAVAGLIALLVLLSCGDSAPTYPEPEIRAQTGKWSGFTSQDRDIQFFVTESPYSVGDLLIVLDIIEGPDTAWDMSEYVLYDLEDGSWALSDTVTDGVDTHYIDVSGKFTSPSNCTGTFTASSETYCGGYLIMGETFITSPEQIQ